MLKNIVAAATLFLVLVIAWTASSIASLAQNPDRGTTLVCVGAGRDGLSLLEWTPEEVADYLARTGHDVAELAPHPETGGCFDLAGLMGGWVPGTSWLCSRDSEERWIGPDWIWSVYQHEDEVGPDPATGRCPQLWSLVLQTPTELERAAATAVHLTELEAAGDCDRLYAWMHPDSQTIVRRVAVEGWYREEFAPRSPVWMIVDGVRLVEWTWEVKGKVYPSAAEVAFRQRFADGLEMEGVTHLVRDDGVWRWFFGRDCAFVDEQIARLAAA